MSSVTTVAPHVYVVEGDIAIYGDDALYQEYLRTFPASGALTVNQVSGVDDIWATTTRLSLYYCIGGPFTATQKQAIDDGLHEAAEGWEAVAAVNFTHLTAQDGAACTTDNTKVMFNVTFDPVQKVQSDGTPLHAYSFFPSDVRSQRVLTIYPHMFDSTNIPGILKHELGHTLGFRHEHIREENPLRGDCPGEDGSYRGVTAYDNTSVMHYARCGRTVFQDIQPLDKRGAWSLYGDPFRLLPGDYDGDGITDLAKDHLGTWFIDYGFNGLGSWDEFHSGYGLQQPIPGRWDGDSSTDIAIFEPATGTFRVDFARNGFNGWDLVVTKGALVGPVAVPADYDGDGRLDLAIKTTSGLWDIDYSNAFGLGVTAPSQFIGQGLWDVASSGYGNASAVPVPADYDGDGKADIAVKTDTGGWKIDYTSVGGIGPWNFQGSMYGDASAIPVPADYDGDGKVDLAIKNSLGEWNIDYAKVGNDGLPCTTAVPCFGKFNHQMTGFGDASAKPLPFDYDHSPSAPGSADLAVEDYTGTWFITNRSASGQYGPWDTHILLHTFPEAAP